MIPSNLFFIWIGEEPKWVNYGINSYKEKNPKFNINYINYSLNDVINTKDSVICRCKQMIFDTWRYRDNKYFDLILHRLKSKMNFLQILCDVLRFELLYYYGGVYVDCDTYCVKPLEYLTENKNGFYSQCVFGARLKNKPIMRFFNNQAYYPCDFGKNPQNFTIHTYNDIYYMCASKEYTDNDLYFDSRYGGIQFCQSLGMAWIRNWESSKHYKKMYKEFYNCKLKDPDVSSYNCSYVLHFPNRSWNVTDYKKGPLYSEYDDYVYGIKNNIKCYDNV